MGNQQDTNATSIYRAINTSDLTQGGTVVQNVQPPTQTQIYGTRGDVTTIDSKYYNSKEVKIEKIKLP